jgi:hypothetical protein
MAQITLLPRRGHLIDDDVRKGLLKLQESGIRGRQQKKPNRIKENGVIVIDSDPDRERAASILRGMGLQHQK